MDNSSLHLLNFFSGGMSTNMEIKPTNQRSEWNLLDDIVGKISGSKCATSVCSSLCNIIITVRIPFQTVQLGFLLFKLFWRQNSKFACFSKCNLRSSYCKTRKANTLYFLFSPWYVLLTLACLSLCFLFNQFLFWRNFLFPNKIPKKKWKSKGVCSLIL